MGMSTAAFGVFIIVIAGRVIDNQIDPRPSREHSGGTSHQSLHFWKTSVEEPTPTIKKIQNRKINLASSDSHFRNV